MNTKLQKFIEAAISNPQHPVYKLGYSQHPILQSYALCVAVFETHTPARWADEYPEKVATMEAVMKLCEEEETVEKEKDERVDAMRGEIDALKATVAALQAARAETPAAPAPQVVDTPAPAPEPSTDA